MRQPSLFNFKPTEVMRSSGLTPEEERQLVGFCLGDDYPRTLVIERTGTRYVLPSETAAALLYKRLRRSGHTAIFGTEIYKEAEKKAKTRRWMHL